MEQTGRNVSQDGGTMTGFHEDYKTVSQIKIMLRNASKEGNIFKALDRPSCKYLGGRW